MSLAVSSSPLDTSTLRSTPSSRNPMTLRLRKILGTTFTDPATTEAKNANDDDDDSWSDLASEGTGLRNGVSGHADVANEAAARVRKNLQRDIESKLAEGSQHFLKAFGEVEQKLDDLQKIVTEMRQHCDDAEAQLKLTEEASRSLLEQAESLRYEM
ncbi:hypothetical protein J3R83DRAFT_14061 [Lanmaoa asiatica]|nr:hypothetical protein J3R83DRAFT_14061 [Lanmaoa asiatica]